MTKYYCGKCDAWYTSRPLRDLHQLGCEGKK